MSEVNGFLNIIAIMDGTTLNGRLRVLNSPLAQRYTKDSTQYVPDWSKSDKSKNPTIAAIIRDASSGAVCTISTIVWKYNNLTLTFDSNGLSSNDSVKGLFKKGTSSVQVDGATYTVPSLTIYDNLASVNNIDNDTITCSGQVAVDGGNYIDFSELTQEVLIEEATSSQLDVVIVSDSDFSIDNKTDEINLTANVYTAGTLDTATEYTYKWFAVTASGDSILSMSKTQKITETMVDSTLKLRCDVLSDGNVIGSGFTEITDYSDPYFVRFDITGIEGNLIKSGQTATITPKAVKRDSAGTVLSDVSWDWKFRDNSGADYNIGSSSTFKGATKAITYENVKGAKKGLNIYVSASVAG